jgi:hypothetical protein
MRIQQKDKGYELLSTDFELFSNDAVTDAQSYRYSYSRLSVSGALPCSCSAQSCVEIVINMIRWYFHMRNRRKDKGYELLSTDFELFSNDAVTDAQLSYRYSYSRLSVSGALPCNCSAQSCVEIATHSM